MGVKIKKYLINWWEDTKAFKWYIFIYMMYLLLVTCTLIYPPEKDSPIFGCEKTSDLWYYVSYDVYIHSLRWFYLTDWLLFFLAMSNKTSHPILSKIIFLYPLANFIVNIILLLAE